MNYTQSNHQTYYIICLNSVRASNMFRSFTKFIFPVFRGEFSVSPYAGWASTFCIAKKVDKNARKGKLLRQTMPFRAAATKYCVFLDAISVMTALLRITLCFLFCTNSISVLFSQAPDSSIQKRPIDANFLLSYYQQEGQHSAVTGGRGTEELTDISAQLTLIVPIDSSGSLLSGLTVNRYSSASTDKIDSRISSASEDDVRVALYLGWEQAPNTEGMGYSYSLGGSIESDYISTSLHTSWYRPLGKKNQQTLIIDGQVYLDRWVLYFPEELRDTIHPLITTDRRFSYHLDIQYQKVINKRLQMSLSTGLSFQQGLLSTPFHRVYFPGEILPRLEHLPAQKWKLPVSIRANYFLGYSLVVRSFYRYYWDDFGIRAHSMNIELPWKLTPRLTLTPSYRLHIQNASNYFQAFSQHQTDAIYYTSDFDLSDFTSHKIGIGIRWLSFKQWSIKNTLNKIDLTNTGFRIAHYRRSDGLSAWALSSFWSMRY